MVSESEHTSPLDEHLGHRLALTLRGGKQCMLGDLRLGACDDVIIFNAQVVIRLHFCHFRALRPVKTKTSEWRILMEKGNKGFMGMTA